MKEDDDIPSAFCSGIFFPIECTQYGTGEIEAVYQHVLSGNNQTKKSNPIFVTEANHLDLIKRLSSNPLFFSENSVWIMPLTYKTIVPLRFDNDIFFYKSMSSGRFVVFEAYAIKGGSPVTAEILRYSEGELEMSKETPQMNLPSKRSDLRGTAINIAWVGYAAHLNAGRNFDILSELQSKLNFTINNIPPKDKSWGAKRKNGTWNGLVGMLIEKKIDMTFGWAGGSMMITPKRAEVVDYLWSDDFVTITLLGSRSSKPRLDIWSFANIFPLTAWLTTFSLIFVGALCFTMSSHESLPQGMALTLRFSLQMPYKIPAISIASKILILVMALSFKIIFIYYTCTLKAIMTSESQPINIRSFEDVVTQGFTVMTRQFGTKPYDILANAPNGSAMKQIYGSDMHFIIYEENEDNAMQRLKGDFKTLYFGQFDKEAQRDNLIPLDIAEAVRLYKAIALEKDSEFTRVFKYHLLNLFENGKIERINHKWMSENDQDYGMEEPIKLGYEHVLFPCSFLALGITLAITMTLVERVAKKSNPKKQLIHTRNEGPGSLLDLDEIRQLLITKEKRIEELESTIKRMIREKS